MSKTDDIIEIIQIINLYGLAVDSQKWDLFDRIFTEDCEPDFGEGAQWTNLKQFKSDFAAFHDAFRNTQHAMSTHTVDVQGDKANAMTYGNWKLMRDGVEGGDLWEGTGWYDDQLIRTSAGWRIKKRVCKLAHWRGNLKVNNPGAGTNFEMTQLVLRKETDAGAVDFFKAIKAQ